MATSSGSYFTAQLLRRAPAPRAPRHSARGAGARAAPVNIRYATGGGIGPNEMETIIWLDYLKQNVLTNYGKAYTLDMTFTRGSPEAAPLLAAGQVDLGDAVVAGVRDRDRQERDSRRHHHHLRHLPGRPSRLRHQHASSCSKNSPIKTVADLKGKKVAHQRLRLGGRSRAARRAEEGRPRSAPRRPDRRGRVPQHRAGHPREARRLRRAGDSVPARRSREGRPARAVHRRRHVRSVLGRSSRSRPTSSSEEQCGGCARFLADFVAGARLVLRPGQPRQGDRAGRRTSPSRRRRCWRSYFITPRDYYRDPNGCVPRRGGAEADRRDGRI